MAFAISKEIVNVLHFKSSNFGDLFAILNFELCNKQLQNKLFNNYCNNLSVCCIASFDIILFNWKKCPCCVILVSQYLVINKIPKMQEFNSINQNFPRFSGHQPVLSEKRESKISNIYQDIFHTHKNHHHPHAQYSNMSVPLFVTKWLEVLRGHLRDKTLNCHHGVIWTEHVFVIRIRFFIYYFIRYSVNLTIYSQK